LRLRPQAGGAALDVQAARQLARRFQAVRDTVAHHVPDLVHAGIQHIVADARALVRTQHLRDRQAAAHAMRQQFVHGVERVRHGDASAAAAGPRLPRG
jgi:hypothetical protein